MGFLQNLSLIFFTSTSGDDPFADLKEIGSKIIPNDIWSFVVQLLATFILVLILAKFLVKPAKNFINARKAFIENNINEAVNKNKEADENLLKAENRLRKSREESKEIINNAKEIAINEQKRIMDETKSEVSAMRDKAYQDIESERLKMKEDLSNEVVDVALLAASKVIDRNVSNQDNRKIVQDFIDGQEEKD